MLSSSGPPALPDGGWRTSSYSGQNGDCIEAGNAGGAVLVRDTKNPGGPAVPFTPAAWRRFTGALKKS